MAFSRILASFLWRVLRTGVFVYLGFLLLIAGCQRTLIYYPHRTAEAALIQSGKSLAVVPWRDPSGQIIGWKRVPAEGRSPRNRLVVFHGNAGQSQDRTHFINGFETLKDGSLWEVYLFEYPGFGARPGKPTERSITEGAEAAVRLLISSDPRPVYLLGESLGTGPACAVASRVGAAIPGVLLLTPYTSMVAAAGFHYPYLPVRLLVRDRWDNLTALPNFRGRVGILLAGRDSVTPTKQGRELFAAANEPKKLWVFPDADHNGFDFSPAAPWWQETSDFLLQQED